MARTPFYINEDLDVFFKGVFSEDCILTGANDTVIDCLYNERFGFINNLDNDVNGITITITLKNADIEQYTIKKGFGVKVRNTNFFIREVRKDGTGISVCELEKIKE